MSPEEYVINDIKRGAERRGYVFVITDQAASELVTSNCYYCGSPPEQNYKGFFYNGIDRVNNDEGYTPGNCVPCCGFCNRAKIDKPVSEFLAWLNRVKGGDAIG